MDDFGLGNRVLIGVLGQVLPACSGLMLISLRFGVKALWGDTAVKATCFGQIERYGCRIILALLLFMFVQVDAARVVTWCGQFLAGSE